MSYNIQNLKVDLQGILHGTTLNQISGLDNLINRAARQLLLEIDPQETKRTVEFVNPILNGIYDYPISADVKGNRLVDIRPQVNRIPRDVWSQAYNQAFDVTKQNIYTMANMFTINFNTGIKTIRIDAPFLNPPQIFTNADTLTGNDSWTGSTFTIDYTNYATGAGALTFNLPAAASTTITDTFVTTESLTANENVATNSFWCYMPTASSITSIVMTIESATGNWTSAALTTTQQGTAFQNGWNLLTFNWDNATPAGAQNAAAISGLTFTFNTDATLQTGMKLNGINSTIGKILEYEYYSKYMFRDAISGAFQETVTDDSNLINLDTETFNLLFNLVAYYSIQQQQGLDATFYDGNFFKEEYYNGVARYKALYKSEAQKPQSTYYRTPDTSNRRFLGRRWNS